VDCRRAEELFSDEVEGTLEDPLRSELLAHLQGCSSCPRLLRAVRDVRDHLAASPLLEAPATLVDRTCAAIAQSSAAPRVRGRLQAPPLRVLAAAAVLTVVCTGGLLYGGAGAGSGRTARRYWEKGVQAGTWALERRDRLIEDLKLVRAVVTMAFEGRLDRMSDRVDDYRRALEKQQEDAKRRDKGADAHSRGNPYELAEAWTRKNL
jgi:anti-sigma factor RsiW